MEIVIRPLERLAEYSACEVLQRSAWAMTDDLEVVPLHMLLAVVRNGGLLLGAFDRDDLVGFVFGFPGLGPAGGLKHCSHMMGVAPDVQSAGIGYRLKLAQRESVLIQGLALITWTYDPLQARNAYLNIHKLGAVCRTYIRDYYGLMADGLNAGLPSDRLQVSWWIAGDRVRQRLSGRAPEPDLEALVMANTVGRTAAGLLTPGALDLTVDVPRLGIEIPADYQAIRSADPGLALAWRLATRQLLEAYFAAGYEVQEFAGRQAEGERRSYYILGPEESHAY